MMTEHPMGHVNHYTKFDFYWSIFIQWAAANNCLDRWLHNTIAVHGTPTMNRLEQVSSDLHLSPENAIINAFDWHYTREDYEYWWLRHLSWQTCFETLVITFPYIINAHEYEINIPPQVTRNQETQILRPEFEPIS